MVLNGVHFHWTAFFVPLHILELYIFALAIAFFLSAAYVKFRDLGHIWEVFLQGALYATPIIYPLQLVMGYSLVAAQALMLSPVAVVMQSARYDLVTQKDTVTAGQLFSNPLWLILPHLIVIVSIILAAIYFKKSQKYFAENV